MTNVGVRDVGRINGNLLVVTPNSSYARCHPLVSQEILPCVKKFEKASSPNGILLSKSHSVMDQTKMASAFLPLLTYLLKASF